MTTTTLWQFALRSIRSGLIDRGTARNAMLALRAKRSAIKQEVAS